MLHIGQADGGLKVGDRVSCQRDQQRRQRILPNHTFTHVLNYALREVLGDDVHQKGSIVQADKLRYAYSNDLIMIGLSYRTNPHHCRLVLHPAETKALTHEGIGSWDANSSAHVPYAIVCHTHPSTACVFR